MKNIIEALNDAMANGYEVATIKGSGYDTEEYQTSELISEIKADHMSSISADMDVSDADGLLTDDNGTLRIELRKEW